MRSTFSSLAVRNYRVYAAGALVSNVGTWFQNVAHTWLVLELTDSGTAVGIAIGLITLPALVISPYAGALADRLDKRIWMAWLQVGMAVPAGLLGALAIAGVVQTWHVYLLSLLFGVARSLEAPVRQSFVAELVDSRHLANAIALNSASFNAARLVGPALAGVLIAAFGSGVEATGWVIVLNAVSYGFAVWSLLALDVDQLRRLGPGERGGTVRSGLAYVRSRPDLVLLLGTVLFLSLFGLNFQVASALLVTDVFDGGAGEYGLLTSLVAVGALAGSLLAARQVQPQLRLLVVTSLIFCVLQALSAVAPSYALYAVAMPFIGLVVMLALTVANATIQLSTSSGMRGRVAALYLVVFQGTGTLGAPLIGWLTEARGPREALVWCSVLMAVGVGATVLWFTRRPEPKVETSAPIG